MENNKEAKKKLFILEFTEEEIAIIKAGLQYCFLSDDFGYALWRTIPDATVGTHDLEHSMRVNEIYKKLEKVLKVKPDYGEWGGLKRLVKLYKKEIKKAKKEGEELAKRLYQESMIEEMEQLIEASRETSNWGGGNVKGVSRKKKLESDKNNDIKRNNNG